ncbi:MAG: xanthine dehydrogenase family protein molybdopterin-binding subunit [Bacillota bacterium]
MKLRYVGESIPRVDAWEKVTGAAVYVADVSLPRMLHAKVLRAGVPHARILSIDTSLAERSPGVRKVVTGRGCGILFGTCLWDQPPLAVDKVRHAGEAVAVVLAETPLQAEQALKKIKVEYDPLPFVLDPIEAASEGAPIIHERNGEYRRVDYVVHPVKGTNIFQHYKLRKGDVEKGFAEADVMVEEEFEFPLSNHSALEPHGAVCRFNADGSVEIWASNQAPFVLRDVLADMFGIPAAKVRVHIPYLGGGFGGKSDVCIEPLVAYAASFVPGYAVRLVLSRKEVFTSSLLGRGMKGRMKIGARRDGTLTALEADLYFSDGAYGDTSWPVVTVAGHNCTGPYEFPNCKVDAYGVYTNSPPVGAFRGYGHPEGHFMVGRLMDMLARKLGMSPMDLMKKNFLCEGKYNAIGQRIKASNGDLAKCLDEVAKAVFVGEKPQEDEKYLYGRGVAAMMKSPKMATNAASTCYLQINGDGSVFINLSGIEMGQGCLTVFTQMAAEALKMPIEKIRMYRGVDTQFTPWEWQTVASMQTYRGGRAILQACERAIALLKANASEALGCPAEEVEYDGEGCFRKGDPSSKLSVGSLARGYMHENGLTVGVPVQAIGSYRVAGVTEPDPETGMGNAAGSWTFGCQAAEVRIEKSTGKVEVLHFASAFDVGKVVNPKTCRGQIVGGVVQGLGAALMEKIEFAEDGTIRNTNYSRYRIPRVQDMPKKLTVEFIETPNEEGPWSAKPMAEHPIVAVAPTILNAIRDATGVDFTRLPVTPKDILEHLEKRK